MQEYKNIKKWKKYIFTEFGHENLYQQVDVLK